MSEDHRTLIFEQSIGFPPLPGTLEDDIFRACCAESDELWEKLCGIPMKEIEEAIHRLQRLGWRFYLVTLQ